MADNSDRDQRMLDRRIVGDQTRKRPVGLNALLEPAILTWRLFWDGRVGILPKLIPLAAAIYVISPVDFIPELAFGPLGMLDDAGIALLAMNLFIWVSPPEIVDEHRQKLSPLPGQGAVNGDQVVDGTARDQEDR